jgi:hypothetical protein
MEAQEWLDKKYPKETRNEITKLAIENEEIRGSLKLEGFTNLRKLKILNNKNLTDLDLAGLPGEKLTEIQIYQKLAKNTPTSISGEMNWLKS